MERRDAVKKMSLAMGGILSATTMTAVLTHCSGKKALELSGNLQFFGPDKFEIISRIVERIIPATDTPGGIETKVPEFIDMMLSECYNEDLQNQFRVGLENFISIFSKEEQEEFQQALEKFEMEMKWNDLENESSFFINTVKELSLLGYFTSMEGATQALRYTMVPGRFDACIPLNGERGWATN